MDKEESLPELGWSHKNGISATLALLDEALCEFEEWAKGRENRSVLYLEQNELSRDQREGILTEVRKMRAILVELRDSLALERKVRSAPNAIWGQCSTLWVSLVELESGHLRRYGELPAGLCEFLDPRTAQLIEAVKEISKIVAGD